jgi:ankyrin repeat protein
MDRRALIGALGVGWLALTLGLVPVGGAAAQDLNDLLILPRAAVNNDFDSVLRLLSRGDAVDTEGEDDRTALCFAAANGNVQIANLLLDHFANIEHRDRFGDTALHWAAINGRVDMVKRLLMAKATVDAPNRQGITPMMMAISNNRREVVRVLVGAGANVRLEDYTGHDAISWARDKSAILAMLQAAATH